jgi:hypothetical protein
VGTHQLSKKKCIHTRMIHHVHVKVKQIISHWNPEKYSLLTSLFPPVPGVIMGSKSGQLHIFFFPFLAHGHLIPTIDIAKLFTARGVKATIVTTPRNVPLVSKTHGMKIDILIIKFPAVEAGLPQGCENCDSLNSPEMASNFIKATKMLQQPLEQLLQDYNPNCLVADSFFPWATDVASKFGIPRLVFNGISFFSMFADHTIRLYEPHKKVFSDSETFVIPNFPGEIKLTRMQLPVHSARS